MSALLLTVFLFIAVVCRGTGAAAALVFLHLLQTSLVLLRNVKGCGICHNLWSYYVLGFLF